jgi:hypothetical protein
MLWILAGLLGAIAIAPLFIRAMPELRGSPELEAALHAAVIGVLMELIPLLILLIRTRGLRRPRS